MIRVLDNFIADKIAAGEVIERPVSIVKELVENSIDAGASSIIIEIRNGGKTYIRVTDNGCGIKADEVETAFLRHATGKISTLEDLDNIVTLGFRGEALASIAAISRLSIVTRTAEDIKGTKLDMHGGQKLSIESVGTNLGTTIIVEDVFYNTPARRKFMASDAREASAIIDLIQKLAIKYSNIKFMLINNKQTILNTPGDGNYQNTILSIYPSSDYKNLIEISGDKIHGYISNPGNTLNNRRGQIFFVNGRIVDSKIIEKGIEEGYGSRIFSGYPIAILFIEQNPNYIDVNIHPGKREIKFLHQDEVISMISDAISSAMNRESAIPKAVPRPRIAETPTIKHEEHNEQVDIKYFLNDFARPSQMPCSFKEETITEYEIKEEPVIDRPFEIDELQVAGYIFNSYIITQNKDNIYVLDQHAAHERIFYEQLTNAYHNKEHKSQTILTPIVIETSQAIYNQERNWLDALNTMGYHIEDFGSASFIIKEIPEFMDVNEAYSFAQNFIESLGEERFNNVVIDKLITKSCKSAVKANEHLSDLEIQELLSELAKCNNPYSCPHGRPTFIKISKYEVERSFKRK